MKYSIVAMSLLCVVALWSVSCRSSEVERQFAAAVELQEEGRWEAALAAYDRAIELDTENAEAYLNRGVVLTNLERPDAALEDLSRAIGLGGDDAVAYYRRGPCT